MELEFIVSLLAAMALAVGLLIYYQTGWKARRRRALERQHHASKRRQS